MTHKDLPPFFITEQNALLLDFRRLTAAVKGTVATAGYDEFAVAFLADVPFPDLIRHFFTSLSYLILDI